jgi:hypothetical protein
MRDPEAVLIPILGIVFLRSLYLFRCGIQNTAVGPKFMDIWWGGTNSYFKYEFVLHTPAGLAWLSQTNKVDMVLSNSKWSCGPPAYRFLL